MLLLLFRALQFVNESSNDIGMIVFGLKKFKRGPNLLDIFEYSSPIFRLTQGQTHYVFGQERFH